jgi:uncharacterized glyoxalase superfamily protein PhnB
MKLDRYLTFGSYALEAVIFYAEVLGGENTMLMRLSEMPEDAH